ncbi:MAG: hypothetical protein IJI21_07545 [Clostridia bacterium]|nr:hypothetical protein [Clostridia bacterium]
MTILERGERSRVPNSLLLYQTFFGMKTAFYPVVTGRSRPRAQIPQPGGSTAQLEDFAETGFSDCKLLSDIVKWGNQSIMGR